MTPTSKTHNLALEHVHQRAVLLIELELVGTDESLIRGGCVEQLLQRLLIHRQTGTTGEEILTQLLHTEHGHRHVRRHRIIHAPRLQRITRLLQQHRIDDFTPSTQRTDIRTEAGDDTPNCPTIIRIRATTAVLLRLDDKMLSILRERSRCGFLRAVNWQRIQASVIHGNVLHGAVNVGNNGNGARNRSSGRNDSSHDKPRNPFGQINRKPRRAVELFNTANSTLPGILCLSSPLNLTITPITKNYHAHTRHTHANNDGGWRPFLVERG